MNELNKDKIIEIISSQKDILKKKFGIKEIYLFGSYSRGEEKSNSDIDLIVEYYDNKNAELKNFDIMIYLEEIFNKDVEVGRYEDLIEELQNFVNKNNLIKC